MKTSLTIAGSLLAALAANAGGLARQDLEKKLQELAKAPPPTKLAPGAMCYDRSVGFERFEYVCPGCGEKTLYGGRQKMTSGSWQVIEADAYRRLVKQLQKKGLGCKLIETAFCQKCGKDIVEKAFVLETRWQEQKDPHRATLRSTEDLQLVQEFLEGKKVHKETPGSGRGETAMKDHLPRLRVLLGLELPKQP